MSLIILYAVKNSDGSVSIFKDSALSELKVRWARDQRPPTYRNRYVTLNCWRWRIVWPLRQEVRRILAGEGVEV